MMELEVYYDYVVILGTRINRPSRISASQWLRYWESVQRFADWNLAA